MSPHHTRYSLFAFGALAAFSLCAPVGAQSLSQSPNAPATDGGDVFQAIFNGVGGTVDNNRDFTDNPTPGQRFTTGSSPQQGLLSITVKGLGNDSAGQGYENGVFGMRISTINGNALTTILSQTASASGIGLPFNGTGNYITFTFSQPVTLNPNTNYAFDLYTSNGYLGLAKNPNGTGGSFNTGSNRNFNSNTASFNPGADRTFYANIEIPEPGTFFLALAGLVGAAPVAARRLRRAK